MLYHNAQGTYMLERDEASQRFKLSGEEEGAQRLKTSPLQRVVRAHMSFLDEDD